MPPRYRVRHDKSVYSGFLKLDLYKAEIEDGDRTVTMHREVHDHGDGAAVLAYDAARKTALMVRQLRMPVHVAEGDGMMLEVAAGLIDPEDASPAEAAKREAGEELGYRLAEVEKVTTVYTIPGLVTERMHLFLAPYTPADKIEGDLGADEDEVITVEEWALADLWAAFQGGRLTDVKAVVCLQALRLRRPDLF